MAEGKATDFDTVKGFTLLIKRDYNVKVELKLISFIRFISHLICSQDNGIRILRLIRYIFLQFTILMHTYSNSDHIVSPTSL